VGQWFCQYRGSKNFRVSRILGGVVAVATTIGDFLGDSKISDSFGPSLRRLRLSVRHGVVGPIDGIRLFALNLLSCAILHDMGFTHETEYHLPPSRERKGKLKLHCELFKSFLGIMVMVLWCCSTASEPEQYPDGVIT